MSRPVAGAILVVGYALSIPPTLRLRPILRDRDSKRFTRLCGGTSLLILGWSLWPRRISVIINSSALAGFLLAWIITGRRQKPVRPQSPH
ncbi:MAG TPA: hypothetical protein VMY34_08615 [Acidimicrobiales bacterium]|nr:hypothetical protein [Acidimicrobiales bacterium]